MLSNRLAHVLPIAGPTKSFGPPAFQAQEPEFACE
jgi:hypothetical protein